MMRIVQSIALGAIGSEHYDDPVGKHYAAFEGIVYDLDQILECLNRMQAMLDGETPRDDLALAACTWQAVILYARCFDSGAEGRQGALGDRAVRTFSANEGQLHAGLLDVRDERFAHAGPDARHRCVLALFEHGGQRWLAPGFEIETPTGMFDADQLALMQSMVRAACLRRPGAHQRPSGARAEARRCGRRRPDLRATAREPATGDARGAGARFDRTRIHRRLDRVLGSRQAEVRPSGSKEATEGDLALIGDFVGKEHVQHLAVNVRHPERCNVRG
jgi:hypothetical protein